jgi:hypothetical protein
VRGAFLGSELGQNSAGGCLVRNGHFSAFTLPHRHDDADPACVHRVCAPRICQPVLGDHRRQKRLQCGVGVGIRRGTAAARRVTALRAASARGAGECARPERQRHVTTALSPYLEQDGQQFLCRHKSSYSCLCRHKPRVMRTPFAAGRRRLRVGVGFLSHLSDELRRGLWAQERTSAGHLAELPGRLARASERWSRHVFSGGWTVLFRAY